MRSRAIEAYKSTLRLTGAQEETLVGLLLGDACLETQNGGRTYRLKVEQSVRHEAYVHHIYELFQSWVLTPPRAKPVRSSNGTYSVNWTFQTISHQEFSFFGRAFYAQRRKEIPSWIGDRLTDRGLAYWFMDDGSMKSTQSKAVILNTHAYRREEVEALVKVLRSRFGLQGHARHQSDGEQIYISGRSYEDLVELINPYVIEEMRYKVPPPRRTQLPKR